MFIAKNFIELKALFVAKLKSMLSEDELGAFILVLTNSQQNSFLKNELAADVEEVYSKLKENFSSGKLNVTPDDSDVFKQLLDIDIDKIPLWKKQPIGAWELVYNPMRRLRPARAASQILDSIKMPYDDNKFHFNKPFLKPEILWQGVYEKLNLRVLFNKFPFSDYHLLIAVSPEVNNQQLLTKDAHELIFSLAQNYAVKFPGFGIGFNSLAAGASVNHLHFQGFIREDDFPIEASCWQHNGGTRDYPLNVNFFAEIELAWKFIAQLIEQDLAFNCLYRKNGCYVIPRKYQGTVEIPDWLEGAGWLDVAGVVTVSDEENYSSIDEQSVMHALERLCI